MSTRPEGGRVSRFVPWRPALALVGALAACAAGSSARASSEDSGLYPGWLDRSVAPGTDFFRFANGGWLGAHPIPPDRSYWGVDTLLERDNQTFIRELVQGLAGRQSPPGSAERKVADFYASGMDEDAVDAAGVRPLEPELGRIEAVHSLDELTGEIAHLQSLGVSAPLSIGQMQDFEDSTTVIAVAAQSGLGLPNRDYYLKTEPNFKAVRASYLQHVARMLVLLGDAPDAANRESGTIMAMETRLAKASMTDVEQRNPRAVYHPLTVERADALTPHLEWHRLFARMGHPEIASLNVGMPDFFRAMDRELERTSIADWKTYLRWQLLEAYAPYLSKPFVEEDFRMTAALTGARELQPRWQRVLRAEDEAIGFAIGELYVKEKFPPAARAAAVEMVGRIRDALRADLRSLAWMTPATRAAAER